MKHQFKWTVLILAAAAGLGTWFFTHKAAPKDESVKTFVTAVQGDLSVTIQAMGVIQPQNRLEIKSPVAGRVDEVLVREGQDVRVGDTVALLSSTERAALLDAARSQGEEVLEHWKTIYKPVPLIAPISGKVIVSTMQPGQSVTQNDAVIVLSDRLIVQAQVDETDIGRVSAGQRAVILLDAYPDIQSTGIVNHIYHESTVVNNVTIYKVDILPDTVPAVFRSGMSANVLIAQDSREDVVLVPSEVIRRGPEASYVLINAGEKETPVRRQVTEGLSDGSMTEIISGLEAGEVLVHESKKYNPAQKTSGGTSPFAPQTRRRPADAASPGPGK